MLRKVKALLGFSSFKEERAAPDQIKADLAIAVQRNERASNNVRALLEEVLDRNDSLQGKGK